MPGGERLIDDRVGVVELAPLVIGEQAACNRAFGIGAGAAMSTTAEEEERAATGGVDVALVWKTMKSPRTTTDTAAPRTTPTSTGLRRKTLRDSRAPADCAIR